MCTGAPVPFHNFPRPPHRGKPQRNMVALKLMHVCFSMPQTGPWQLDCCCNPSRTVGHEWQMGGCEGSLNDTCALLGGPSCKGLILQPLGLCCFILHLLISKRLSSMGVWPPSLECLIFKLSFFMAILLILCLAVLMPLALPFLLLLLLPHLPYASSSSCSSIPPLLLFLFLNPRPFSCPSC